MSRIMNQLRNILLNTYDEYDETECIDYRETIEIRVQSPKQFVAVATAIQAKGWNATQKNYEDRLLIGVAFDSDPVVTVMIGLANLEEWQKRYKGQSRETVPVLAAASNHIIRGQGDIIVRVQDALLREKEWIDSIHKNRSMDEKELLTQIATPEKIDLLNRVAGRNPAANERAAVVKYGRLYLAMTADSAALNVHFSNFLDLVEKGEHLKVVTEETCI